MRQDVEVERVLVNALGLLAQVFAHARQVRQLMRAPPRWFPVVHAIPCHVPTNRASSIVVVDLWIHVVIMHTRQPILELLFQTLFCFGFVPLRSVL